ncbi:MAG TPA: C45 family peptidase [Thermoanaerobaculia bacterium]
MPMGSTFRTALALGLGVCTMLACKARESAPAAAANGADARLARAWRFEQNGWIYVHLEGSPSEIGFQHGSLLSGEIADAFEAVKLSATHMTKKPWEFFRDASHSMLWPKMDPEYQEEIRGIVEGLASKSVRLDADDVVALNAFEELPDYYVPWYNAQHQIPGPTITSPGNCSAFVATGSYTKDGTIVIAHNNWTSYLTGERWRIVFDLVPAKGHRILMDGFPGVITSDDDFGVNDSGLMVTETTITQFAGWDPNGKPEFERSRKALQYADSIDEYVRIMRAGNNGGYANDWLLGDRKTGEIAQFEQGLKHDHLWRTKDGVFVGSNFASDPQVLAEDTHFDSKDRSSSPNARHDRWEALMNENKGKIDVETAKTLLADHWDAFDKKPGPNERSLCGHTDVSPRGVKDWEWEPFHPGGAVQGKAMDSAMAGTMQFVARMGHPCGEDFLAGPFLEKHPEFAWQAPKLTDMKAGAWTTFRTGQRQPEPVK